MTASTLRTPTPTRLLVPLVCLTTFVGCARYEYDLVRPPDLARHIGGKSLTTFSIDDREYALQSYDSRLVMRIANRAGEPVKLLGGDSYAIDPGGESHPLADRVIPPGGHIKLILPPPPQQVRETGPRFGIGLGVGVSNAGFPRRGYGYGGGAYDDLGPRYYSVYDPNDATIWQWNGETEATLRLTFEKGKERVSDEFVLRRRKM
jgi:hypothetical protein